MVNEQQEVSVKVPQRLPLWRRVGEGAAMGVVAGVVVIGLLIGAQGLVGDSPLEKRVDRNAAITTAGMDGIRCILKIKPDPERPFKETKQLIDDCFVRYDRLKEGAK